MGHEGIVATCQTGRRGHFGKREWPMQRHGCMKNTMCPQESEKFCVARTDLVGMLDKVKMKKPAGAMTQRPAWQLRLLHVEDPHCRRWPWRQYSTRRFGHFLFYASFCLASNCCNYNTLPAIDPVVCALENLELQEGWKHLDGPGFKFYFFNLLRVLGPII